MSYRVLVTPPAEVQVLEAGIWWLENRPKAPELFDEELARAFDFLSAAPHSGVQLRGRRRGLRRIVLHGSRYYVYYRVNEAVNVVEVVSVWHTSKGKGPPL